MLQLDNSVKLVALQFNFSNPNVIPASVKQVEVDSLEDRLERKKREGNDKIVIEPTMNVYLAYLVDDLHTAGYELVDAFYQPRVDPKDPAGKRIYHMVRFLFARKPNVQKIYKGFMEVRPIIYTDLQGMCVEAMWRVRAFLNPSFKKDEHIHVKRSRTLSINLEVRRPLFGPDDQHTLIWEKDESGNRVGDEPMPLMPDYCLRITDGYLKLL